MINIHTYIKQQTYTNTHIITFMHAHPEIYVYRYIYKYTDTLSYTIASPPPAELPERRPCARLYTSKYITISIGSYS